MSKEQVARDYQKLLLARQKKMMDDAPKGFFARLIYRMTAHYYPMPLMPLDDDFRRTAK